MAIGRTYGSIPARDVEGALGLVSGKCADRLECGQDQQTADEVTLRTFNWMLRISSMDG